MANLTQHLTSISPDLRSGSSPGRRLLALVLCSMLVIGSVFPGVALAREADSEGEGSSPSIELPEPPDFDPGGEETGLEEVPATGGDEEGGAVEIEPEVDIEVPPPEEVTGAAAEAPPPPPPAAPEAPTYTPEPQPVQEAASQPEPVANQPITAPKQAPADRPSASESAAPPEEAPPPEQEAPSSPQPVAAPPADTGRNLAGRGSYVVRPGDCLWHIAAGLLPDGAGDAQIAQEVQRIWRLNEDRIGTGDPNLLLVGTELRLT